MKYFTIHVPKEDTYGVVEKLASHDFVQFIDTNSNAFHRPYTNSLKRCEEVLNKLKILFSKVHKEGFELPEVPRVEFVFENHKECKELLIQIFKNIKWVLLPFLTELRKKWSTSSNLSKKPIEEFKISKKKLTNLKTINIFFLKPVRFSIQEPITLNLISRRLV